MIIIVDKGASNIEELKKWDRRIAHSACFTDLSGVYVACTSGGIFHSKGYLAKTSKYGEFYIGSMNLTNKGISGNEELVIEGSYTIGSREHSAYIAERFDEYVDYLIESKSQRVRDVQHSSSKEADDIRSLFLDGRIFYESNEQNPFRFNLQLPDELLKAESPLNQLLESKTSNSLNISALIADLQYGLGYELPQRNNSKAMWKRYCIQTCYGYWCPSEYQADLQVELNKKISANQPYYKALYTLVTEYSAPLYEKLKALISSLAGSLDHRHGQVDWVYLDKNKLDDAWKRWLENIHAKFQVSGYLDRLSCGIKNVATPDVWGNPNSVKDFETSIFESVIYELAKAGTKTTRNEPAYAFSVELDIDRESTADELRAKLTQFLSKNNRSIFIDEEEN
ncbi:hypothetical protein NX722_27830 [Endozoicomonas gorgoniicola]|uniref:PLD phosphodiesterase domain-containing protein n=1 Tax=Endozoicomonas gorgoniicola TaxID=1234144 RepID=A0ABT3N419_9GAMM|nr:hypothetical protein [Endozoicomonas gorgoniicola]MCW7556376.1 hypothetical protein [Endozoicomonas gorgoniicola]